MSETIPTAADKTARGGIHASLVAQMHVQWLCAGYSATFIYVLGTQSTKGVNFFISVGFTKIMVTKERCY